MIDPTHTWLVIPGSWGRLHYVTEIEWENEGAACGNGKAVCGLSRRFATPDAASRMTLPRCTRCCNAVSVPIGMGVPDGDE